MVNRDGDGNDNNFTVNYALLQVYAKIISRRDFMQQNSWKFIQGVAIIKSECFFFSTFCNALDVMTMLQIYFCLSIFNRFVVCHDM